MVGLFNRQVPVDVPGRARIPKVDRFGDPLVVLNLDTEGVLDRVRELMQLFRLSFEG